MSEKQMVGICCGRFGNPEAEKARQVATASLVEGLGFRMMSLCEPVRQVARTILGGKDPDLNTINGVCITGRRITENYWLNITVGRINPDCDRVVFCDVFFSNECRYIRSSGGLVIKITSDAIPEGDFDFDPDVTVGYGSGNTEIAFVEAVRKTVASFFDRSGGKQHIIATKESQ